MITVPRSVSITYHYKHSAIELQIAPPLGLTDQSGTGEHGQGDVVSTWC